MHKVAIVGASGYAGAELMRICAAHPEMEVVAVAGGSSAGARVADLYPNLAAAYGDTTFAGYSPDLIGGTDLAFLALPHGQSSEIAPEVMEITKRVVDLAADFRFSDPSVYPKWYGEEHHHPELLAEFAYGIPELFRDSIVGAGAVAAAGCYVTTAALALAPLVGGGLVEPTGIVVDAVSGVSGAGRALKHSTSFTTVDENFTAYGLVSHRHTPEIEMAIAGSSGVDTQVVFTPHLAPMNRGILATCYARSVGDHGTAGAIATLGDFYQDEPFVVVGEKVPETKATTASNSVHITARVDERTGWTVVVSALDNLVKGAAGQAVQCANLMLGLPEETGLATTGVYP